MEITENTEIIKYSKPLSTLEMYQVKVRRSVSSAQLYPLFVMVCTNNKYYNRINYTAL